MTTNERQIYGMMTAKLLGHIGAEAAMGHAEELSRLAPQITDPQAKAELVRSLEATIDVLQGAVSVPVHVSSEHEWRAGL